jgi:signal peptidase II
LVVFFIIIAVLSLDVLTKRWVSHAFYFGEIVPIFPGFNLTLAHNTGAAFSFLADGAGWQRVLLSAVAVIVTLVFSVWLYRTPASDRVTTMGLSLIIAGAIGNLIDRLWYGYVVDFLDVYVSIYHWPAFNVADSAICIGVGFLLLEVFRRD